jgi:hypothetical protein
VVVALVIGAVVELAGLGPLVEAMLSLAFALYIGFAGNDWRRRRLARRGYEEAAVIAAGTLIEAERRYFDRAGPDAAVPA